MEITNILNSRLLKAGAVAVITTIAGERHNNYQHNIADCADNGDRRDKYLECRDIEKIGEGIKGHGDVVQQPPCATSGIVQPSDSHSPKSA